MLNWLLIFVPAAIALEFARPDAHAAIFLVACLGIVPLAEGLRDRHISMDGVDLSAILADPPPTSVPGGLSPLRSSPPGA